MSDNSSSSSGSSNNSWTILSPEEAAVESVGPVDDGTESLSGIPGLPEEATGLREGRGQVESLLSEEGQQVCQETNPETFEGAALLDPTFSTHNSSDFDPEIRAPVIHDTITSSPPDSDLLGSAPFGITTESVPFHPDGPACSPPPSDVLTESGPAACQEGAVPETSPSLPSEKSPDITHVPYVPAHDASEVLTPSLPPPVSASASERPGPIYVEPDTIGTETVEEEEEEPAVEKDETELPEKEAPFENGESDLAELPGEGSGLRLRHAGAHEQFRRASDDDEDEGEEEEEFRLPEKKEEKQGFSLNKLIVGALLLLFLGSLFFCDDGAYDGSEPTEQELLAKLAQEKQQISYLEAQLQSQKEALDKALATVTEKGEDQQGDLKMENARLKQELLTLQGLKDELETLRSRVTELSQLTDKEAAFPAPVIDQPEVADQISPGADRAQEKKDGLHVKAELRRQRELLEESRNRLQEMKTEGGQKKGVRQSLVEMQQRLSEQVNRLNTRHEWKKKNWESKGKNKHGQKKGRNGKGKPEEVDKPKGDEDWKRKKEGRHRGGQESQDEQARKEAWKKYHKDWDGKKEERRLEREMRKKEQPWKGNSFKKTSDHHNHPHNHQKQQHHQLDKADFWKHQEEKLRRNPGPAKSCKGVAQCAKKEGLVPVELSEFQELLEGYLSKLEKATTESKDELRLLVTKFFHNDVFIHDHMLFGEFAEDVADILEDVADMLEDGDGDEEALEEEMEEFEREALWKFAAAT
ncbi:pre-B-cell leukemia transcription factor-interacting protein 1 isoform X2 [Denticeps clupeoides]|uniref:pre-B-cell leukemia transcription factor-interacting protein 1 isoform X2 n=1 Tax=Denticeps clupeoides TaxID=299321 RepID=UPI0010A304C2|nr:pre-B-cell leukemia transcription factor-interacting protein 1-like isoform X2 [Denticeps clupeoides]